MPKSQLISGKPQARHLALRGKGGCGSVLIPRQNIKLGVFFKPCWLLVFPRQVTHQAVVDVSEAGTKAAAATATKLTARSKDGPSHTVCFNRPFLLLILSSATQTTLFLGKVEDPTQLPAGKAFRG